MALDWHDGKLIYDKLSADCLQQGEPVHSLYQELLRNAIRYAGTRAEYALESQQGRVDHLEENRTRAHDALICACNALSRAMAASGSHFGEKGLFFGVGM
jgi:hypothetical protein